MKVRTFIFLLFLPVATYAESSATPIGMVQTFFTSLKSGETDTAYNQLLLGADVFSKNEKNVAIMKQRALTTLNSYGEIIGYDILKKNQIGGNVMELTYILKSEKHPTIWQFYFYRPKARWFIINMAYTNKLHNATKDDKGVPLFSWFSIF